MGYNLYIGEVSICPPEEKYEEFYMHIIEAESDDAPVFGFSDISGKSNGRYPSYTAMSNFADDTGLRDLFYDKEEGLIVPHPGIKRIYQDDLNQITNARLEWEKTHPDCKNNLPTLDKVPADFAEWKIQEQVAYERGFDWTYARLIWFEFWFDWALKNCKHPAIQNG